MQNGHQNNLHFVLRLISFFSRISPIFPNLIKFYDLKALRPPNQITCFLFKGCISFCSIAIANYIQHNNIIISQHYIRTWQLYSKIYLIYFNICKKKLVEIIFLGNSQWRVWFYLIFRWLRGESAAETIS